MKLFINEVSQWLGLSSILFLLLVSTTLAQNTTTVGPENEATKTADAMSTMVSTEATEMNTGPTTKGVTTNSTKGPEPKTTPKADMTTKKTTGGKVTTEAAPSPAPSKGVGVAGVFCIIVLIICLIGIGFCGYQFYRKRQTDDYHTL